MVSHTFEQCMNLLPAIVFQKYLCKLTIDDGNKEYLCKSIINNGGLVGEEIHVYIKFTHRIELNNI